MTYYEYDQNYNDILFKLPEIEININNIASNKEDTAQQRKQSNAQRNHLQSRRKYLQSVHLTSGIPRMHKTQAKISLFDGGTFKQNKEKSILIPIFRR